MKAMLATVLLLAAQDAKPDELQSRIDALKVDKVVWREIPWRTCLLDGLKQSREQKKPVILWIFIDRPVDDERC